MSTVQDLIGRQGWDDETMLMLYDEFIAKMNLDDAFAEYLELIAEEENAESISPEYGATGPKEK